MYRSFVPLAALALMLPVAAGAQTATANFGADPTIKMAQRREARGTLLDYVLPYMPFVGPKREERKATQAAVEAPPMKAEPAPKKRKRAARAKPAKAKPEPAAEKITAPDPATTVVALTQCLSRYTAIAVKAGDISTADALMARAADTDCKTQFRATARAVTLAEGDAARDRLARIIEAELSPAVETAMASARAQ